MRWQRPDRTDNLVHPVDIEDAIYLVSKTFEFAIPVYRMIMEDKSSDKWLKIEEIIRRHGRISRIKLMQEGHVPSTDIKACVDSLAEQGLVEVVRGKQLSTVTSRDKNEIYQWVGDLAGSIEKPTVSRTLRELNGHRKQTTAKKEVWNG